MQMNFFHYFFFACLKKIFQRDMTYSNSLEIAIIYFSIKEKYKNRLLIKDKFNYQAIIV